MLDTSLLEKERCDKRFGDVIKKQKNVEVRKTETSAPLRSVPAELTYTNCPLQRVSGTCSGGYVLLNGTIFSQRELKVRRKYEPFC